MSGVTRKIWEQRENARTDDDAKALRHIDTGVERERDLGVTIDAKGTGEWSQRVARPFGSSAYVVPRERGYPKDYLAVVQTSAPYSGNEQDHAAGNLDWVALLVFTKAGPEARWRVAMESGGTGSMDELPHSQLALHDSSKPRAKYSPSASQPSWIRPETALADLYQHYADFGTRPAHSVFQPGT